jgi:hypothetical protein
LSQILLTESLARSLLFGQLCSDVLLEKPKTPFAVILNRQSRVQSRLARVEVGCPGLKSIEQFGRVQPQPIVMSGKLVSLSRIAVGRRQGAT